mgnify:CR=1 FL=1
MLGAICAFIRFFTGAQVRWNGCEPAAVQRVYYANHTSHCDCLVLLAVLPAYIRQLVRPAAAADYWNATKLRRWFSHKILHIIPIDRSKLTRANNPINKLLGAVDEGSSLIFFPEGGRGAESTVREFKSGLYHLSKARPNLELIPTYIDNGNRILPKGEFIPVPILCSVTFGEPIKLLPNERKEDFLKRAQSALEKCAS